MKIGIATVVVLVLASCAASKTSQVPDAVPTETGGPSVESSQSNSPASFFSRDFTTFFQTYRDENYQKFLELLDQYEKEEPTGRFAKEKLEMRLRAEIALESKIRPDVDMNTLLLKYVGRVIEVSAKATGKIESSDQSEDGPLTLSEDRKTLSMYFTLRSPKYKTTRFDYMATLSPDGEHELSNGYYYIYEGKISSVQLVQSDDLVEVRVEISDATLSIDPNI